MLREDKDYNTHFNTSGLVYVNDEFRLTYFWVSRMCNFSKSPTFWISSFYIITKNTNNESNNNKTKHNNINNNTINEKITMKRNANRTLPLLLTGREEHFHGSLINLHYYFFRKRKYNQDDIFLTNEKDVSIGYSVFYFSIKKVSTSKFRPSLKKKEYFTV